MRRRTLNLAVPFIILTLTLSFVAVLPAASQDTSLIITKLQDLRKKVENEHPALENKVNAVIHQIRAGAFNGALNKLENDVKKSILAWVDDPADLIELVDEIIDLIQGLVPPKPPIPDFKLEADPDELTITQGSSGTSTIIVKSINGFNKTVNLTVTSEPIAGTTTTLNPSEVTPPADGSATSTLTVEVAVDAEPGAFVIVVTGKNGSLEHTVKIKLTITAPQPTPDFSISASPTSLTINQGSFKISIITVTSLYGFSETVSLSITSAPISGVSVTFNPEEVTPAPNHSTISMLTVEVDETATLGDYTISVTGKSGTLQKSVNIQLTIEAAPPPPEPEDTTPPEIHSVLRLPEKPTYNESVTVLALVTDAQTGVKKVMLNYSDGTAWTAVDMALSGGLFNRSIPAFPLGTLVEYRVIAYDNADNRAESSLNSYATIDPYLPFAKIDKPLKDSYLKGMVSVTVRAADDNFKNATLSIDTVPAVDVAYTAAGEHTFSWDTTDYNDGVYTIKLNVRDKAENVAQESLTVTVDNTLPSAVINAPAHGSYLRLSTLVKVTGTDANFDKMEVRIDNTLVKTSTTSGSEVLELNTRSYSDSAHNITLRVYDKAGNMKQALVSVTIDNMAPLIGTPSWSPKEPEANVDIQINVTVIEPAYGSGVQNVTLWFKNKTMDDWQFMLMEARVGNWTATLKNQSDTEVRFFIEAFDKAGNNDMSPLKKFTVAAPAGFPLAWLLAAIAAIGAGSGGGAYYVKRRRKKRMAASVPAAISMKPVDLPRSASTGRNVRRRARSGAPARSNLR